MKFYNASCSRFLEYAKNKDLICYGAGKMLDEMSRKLSGLLEVVGSLLIVDGDRRKQGKERNLFGKTFIIESIDDAIDKAQNPLILITSGALLEIVDELKNKKTEELSVFSFMLMRKEELDHEMITIEDAPEIMGKNNNEQIPRIIHYFWFGNGMIPDDYKRNMETWREKCPNYEFILWNEDNCDLDECRYAEEAYRNGRYGFVPDYYRLKRVYEYGGIYLDLDVKLLKPLDELLYLDAYAGFEDNNKVALGVGFGARKGFPLIKEMYEIYDGLSFENNDGTLNTVASPVYQTEVLKAHGLMCNGKMQTVAGMTILPMNYLTVQSNYTGRQYITEKSVSIHQYAASWLDEKDLKNKRFAEQLLREIEMI